MNLAPKIKNQFLDFVEWPYTLRYKLKFKSRNICSVMYGIKTSTFVVSRKKELYTQWTKGVYVTKLI